MTRTAIETACDESLRRLQTEYIDLYLFHDGAYPVTQAEEVRELLEGVVQTGKIRFYGWSTDDPERAQVFASGRHCAAMEFRLNLFFDAPRMIEVCAAHDLFGLIKQPLSSGTLTGKFTADTTFAANDERQGTDFRAGRAAMRLRQVAALRDVLTSDGRSFAQGALSWIWARSSRAIPIPGFKTAAQVEENAGALRWGPLSAAQMRQVDEILRSDSL